MRRAHDHERFGLVGDLVPEKAHSGQGLRDEEAPFSRGGAVTAPWGACSWPGCCQGACSKGECGERSRGRGKGVAGGARPWAPGKTAFHSEKGAPGNALTRGVARPGRRPGGSPRAERTAGGVVGEDDQAEYSAAIGGARGGRN